MHPCSSPPPPMKWKRWETPHPPPKHIRHPTPRAGWPCQREANQKDHAVRRHAERDACMDARNPCKQEWKSMQCVPWRSLYVPWCDALLKHARQKMHFLDFRGSVSPPRWTSTFGILAFARRCYATHTLPSPILWAWCVQTYDRPIGFLSV